MIQSLEFVLVSMISAGAVLLVRATTASSHKLTYTYIASVSLCRYIINDENIQKIMLVFFC